MEPSRRAPDHDALSRALVEQILMTGMMLADLMTDLIEGLPEDAFPGENHCEVLLEMLAGSSVPVVGEAGPELVDRTIALIRGIGDGILADLRTAAELVAEREAGRENG